MRFARIMKNKQRTNNSQLRTLAEKMYVEEYMTAKAISDSLGVSPQTIGRWKQGIGDNGEDWDVKRERHKREPYNIRKLINEEVARIARGEEPSLDMKALNEAIKAMNAISNKVSPEAVYTVFREFDNWLSGQDPEMAIKLTDLHKQFLIYKVQEEEGK